MLGPPPRHVGDVQQPVDAPEIDEGAVVGDVLHHALHDLALGEVRERVLLLLRVLLFDEHLARQHDVAPLLVHLDHAHAQLLAAQRVEIADGTDVDLRAGQERAHADVDREAALDALDHAADDDLAIRVGLLDLVPDLHLLGLLAREHDVAVAILGPLEQHVDGVARMDHRIAVLVVELRQRDQAFRLVADVDDHLGVGHPEHGALDDLALGDVLQAALVEGDQAGVLFRIDQLLVRIHEPRRLGRFRRGHGGLHGAGGLHLGRVVWYVHHPVLSFLPIRLPRFDAATGAAAVSPRFTDPLMRCKRKTVRQLPKARQLPRAPFRRS